MRSRFGTPYGLAPWICAVVLAASCTTQASDEPSDAAAVPPSPSPWPEALEELDPAEPAQWNVSIVSQLPHDPSSFTQGLEVLTDGRMIESVGLYGQSDVRIVDVASGTVAARQPLPAEHFGEGVTVVDDVAIQLTWRAGVAHRWSLPDLEPLPALRYDGEGWGICRFDDPLATDDDGVPIVVTSDGTATLTWRVAETFEPIRTAIVVSGGAAVDQINELECVDGHVVANVWQSDQILVIRDDGFVVAEIDGSPLIETTQATDDDPDVLNGIALASDTTFWLTGKLWSTLYEVSLSGS